MILMYLRKSRSDDASLTVEQVLSKHEQILQEYAVREFGHVIPEEQIYREVVSGESIEDRVEIKRVLSRLEDPAVTGVLVVEPQRLGRGDLEDCGRLITLLRLTGTKVYTPSMVYDLEHKMDRRFFQDELLRGRDYLEYTKEILLRGRIAAVKRGCWIASTAPYGYRRVKIGRDYTLEVVEDQAEVVRLIFRRFATGELPAKIAQELEAYGCERPSDTVPWKADTVYRIAHNPAYIGKVQFGRRHPVSVVEFGEVKKVDRMRPDDEIVTAEGKHQPIVSRELWEAARAIDTKRPRPKVDHELVNVLAGVLYCGGCGRAMSYRRPKTAYPRYVCPNKPMCYKSVRADLVQSAVIVSLEQSELPDLVARAEGRVDEDAIDRQKLIRQLEDKLEDYRAQESKQYDLLETGRYTQELFDLRNAALREKMEICTERLAEARAEMPRPVDYASKVVSLKAAIEALKASQGTVEARNRVLRSIVKRVEFFGQPPMTQAERDTTYHDEISIAVDLRI